MSAPPRAHLGKWIAAAVLVAVVTPVVVVEALTRDAKPPAELTPDPGEAERLITGQFDLIPVVDRVRYVDLEYRKSDHLVLLYFEIRRYPYLASEEVWLGSRCVPLADFTTETYSHMDGGYVHASRAADRELVYVRGPDQPPC